jgi:hypothetical protein
VVESGSAKGEACGTWEEAARAAPPCLDRPAVAAAVRGVCGGVRPTLNASQRTAVKRALARSVSVVQGPPGTGKTLTAACVVVAAVAAGAGPVLATAASNVAVDNLMGKVLAVAAGAGRKMSVVRVGRVAAVEERLWGSTLEGLLERDKGVRRAREEAAKDPAAAAAAREVEQKAALRIVRAADVVMGTCVGAGREVLADVKFRFVLCDEAAQVTEPDLLVPLTAGLASALGQLVLVGDHHQLPPTVLSDGTAPDGLGRSLFSRLWSSGVSSTLLDTQYRMHPDIAAFPARHFYFSRLNTAVGGADRPVPAHSSGGEGGIGGIDAASLMALLLKRRVLFVNAQDGRDERDGALGELDAAFSYVNRAEARVACNIARQLPFPSGEVGLISPYSAQVRLMSRILATDGESAVEVSTVDGFQGREKSAIVFSAVRNNEAGRVGFLGDWRRLNVALTRARAVLIVVGAFPTLRHDPHWSSWLQSVPVCDIKTLARTVPQ